MLRCANRALLPVLLAISLTASVRAAVSDEAGFFSPDAARRADDEIQEIKRQTGKDLVVETFKAVPEDQAKAVRSMNRAARDAFFAHWAQERARELGVDGVYVLICKSPAQAQVVLGPGTEDRLFPEPDRAELTRLLTPRFTRKQYDSELLDGVTLVRRTLYYNLNHPGAPRPEAMTWPAVLLVIGGLLGLWLVVVVIRATVSARDHQLGPAAAAAEPVPAVTQRQTVPAGVDSVTRTYHGPVFGPDDSGDF